MLIGLPVINVRAFWTWSVNLERDQCWPQNGFSVKANIFLFQIVQIATMIAEPLLFVCIFSLFFSNRFFFLSSWKQQFVFRSLTRSQMPYTQRIRIFYYFIIISSNILIRSRKSGIRFLWRNRYFIFRGKYSIKCHVSCFEYIRIFGFDLIC